MAEGPRLKAAVCQIPVTVGEPLLNRERAESAIREAAEGGAQLVVLPELANSGYVFEGAEEARSLAEPVTGPTARSWASISKDRGIAVVGGICELAVDGSVHNSALFFDNGHLSAVYRKAHLWDTEIGTFTPGDSPPPIVATEHGRISVMVCYDAEFPEWVRIAALRGADVLCVPTSWPRLAPDPGPFPVEVLRLLAAANANLIYVAAAARLGHERGIDWVPGSGIAGPAGDWLTPLEDGPCVLMAELDMTNARQKMTSERNHQLHDRRPELYEELTSPTTPRAGARAG